MAVRKRTWRTREGGTKEAWVVDYVAQSKRHIKTFDRKKDADAYSASVTVDVARGVHIAPSESPTVAEVGERWIKRVAAEGRERSTVQQYRQHLDLHIKPKIGDVKLANLTPQTVEAFRDQLLAQLSRALARKVFTSFRSALKVAKFSHVVADVRISAAKRKPRLEPGRDIPLPGEIARIIAAAVDDKMRALLLLVALTGLRSSEARGLRWIDIDLKAEELSVRQRADRYGAIGRPKSDSSVRTIPLPPELSHALKRWKLACPKYDADLVFPSRSGAPDPHENLRFALVPIMQAAGTVDKQGRPKYGLHAFRHFFASWCINPRERGGRELPPKQVQQLLGHSSIVLTMDIYGHLFRDGGNREELAAATRALLDQS